MIVAQMAESVDALVSNTSGVTSIPVRPRVWVQDKGLNICLLDIQTFSFLSIVPKCLEQRFWLFLCLPQVVQLMPFVQEDLQWCDSSKSLIFILDFSRFDLTN